MTARPVGSNQILTTVVVEPSPLMVVVDPDHTTGLILLALGGWPRARLELGVDQALELSLALVAAVSSLGLRKQP
jgi:hypothetical protein